jgi:hypothetical protein
MVKKKVRKYSGPTEALYGSFCLEKPIKEPKKVAREYIKKKVAGEFS